MDASRPFFSTPQEAEAAFYDARERADIEALMTVWADDEEIVCIHPGGPRHAGYTAVRESWRQIFAGTRATVRTSHTHAIQGVLISVHSLHEHSMGPGNRPTRQPVIVTNIYMRGPLGWRLLVHHASFAPATAEPGARPTLLH